MTSRKGKKNQVARIALGVIAAAGIVAAVAVAPGVGAALRMIDRNPKKAVYKLNRALSRLVSSGDISCSSRGYKLSLQGNRRLARLRFDAYKLARTKRWDGKWRVVCFDIPEVKRFARALIHHKLRELGFYRLQDSIFITPEPCGEFLHLSQEAFGLQDEIRGLVVSEMDDDASLRRYFNL